MWAASPPAVSATEIMNLIRAKHNEIPGHRWAHRPRDKQFIFIHSSWQKSHIFNMTTFVHCSVLVEEALHQFLHKEHKPILVSHQHRICCRVTHFITLASSNGQAPISLDPTFTTMQLSSHDKYSAHVFQSLCLQFERPALCYHLYLCHLVQYFRLSQRNIT